MTDLKALAYEFLHEAQQSLQGDGYLNPTAVVITPDEVRPEADKSTVVVLVGRVHKGVVKALRYAQSMRPNNITAVYVAYEDADTDRIEQECK